MPSTRCAVVAMLVLVAPSLIAQDVPGSSDHAVVARFKGSTILAQDRKDFDQYIVPLGPPDKSEEKFQIQQTVEGKVVKTLYDAPANTSTAAVFRSYQTALQQAGF